MVGACLLPANTARADDKKACLEAYDKAQTLRQDDKLVAAREQLLMCARDVCPGILRKDCTQWLSEVDASMPTVVLAVKDAEGRDLVDVDVTVDGEPFATQIDGKAVPVDPGVHTFRFEAEGVEPVEERVVIHEAAKNRTIHIRFGGGEGGTGEGSVDGEGGGVELGTDDPGSSRTLAYIFGGVGLAGLGAFTYFGTQFDSKLDDMDACKPNCPQSDADDASTTRTLAFVSAGVGVVSLGVATYLFLSTPSKKEAATETSSVPRVDVLPVPGGAYGTIGARITDRVAPLRTGRPPPVGASQVTPAQVRRRVHICRFRVASAPLFLLWLRVLGASVVRQERELHLSDPGSPSTSTTAANK